MGKPLYSAVTNTCLLFIYPHLSHSLPRIWDHQAVFYWPETGSFWQCYWYQLILICFKILPWFDRSTALWACLKITMNLRWIEPITGFSLGIYSFSSVFPSGNTVVPLIKNWSSEMELTCKVEFLVWFFNYFNLLIAFWASTSTNYSLIFIC